MITVFNSKKLSNRSRKSRRRPRKSRQLSLQALQARELMAADLSWDGDALKISGTESSDFIAVQSSELGTRVFANDAFYAEHEGRSIGTAKSIEVSGGGGNDILFSYQSPVPVNLSGDNGNDFLFSDDLSDSLDGGDGSDWVYSQETDGLWENAFGVEGLNLNPTSLNGIPQFDENEQISLRVEVGGQTEIEGTNIDVSGVAEVGSTGIDVELTGTVPTWPSAFGVSGLDLTDTSLTLSAGSDVHEGNGYSVGIRSNLDASGTAISIDGSVDVTENEVAAVFSGSVANWESAFGITGLDLKNAELSGRGSVDGDDNTELSLGIRAEMIVEETFIDVSGDVDIAPDRVDAQLHGSIDQWDDAFGITGLFLTDSEVNIAAYTNHADDYGLHVDLLADMEVGGTDIDVAGQVDLAPNRVDATFNGSVDNWDDAFGVDGLYLNDTDLEVIASTNRTDDSKLQLNVSADMDVDGTNVAVNGLINLESDRVAATLSGFVAATWTNAFGIQGLALKDTNLSVSAARETDGSSSLQIDLDADMDVSGTLVAVTGNLDVDPAGTSGLLSGTVDGEWASALGVEGLNLLDTTLSMSAAKTESGSELTLAVDAGMNLFGTHLGVSGAVDFTPDGVRTNLTGSVDGEWIDAFGIPALQLQDTSLTIATGSAAESGLSIALDTDLQLFGGYIDVIGDLGITPAGPTISFTPPGAIDFTDLLGIPGFTLDSADLRVTAGSDGIEVAVNSTMEMGDIDVGFEGAFAVGKTDVLASLTGYVDTWNNAFDIPGLNLEDVVMTLGAESSAQGASMFIGLGAGINIGTKKLDVAGLVGVSATGWDVAFRGSVDSLTSIDLIDFANTISQAGDPDAPEIPQDALGEFELKEAYINFAPKGGNEELGIADGFGIGGDFYEDGELLAGGEFEIDLELGSFQVELEIPELDLGPVDLSDVVIDIRIAPLDSHFKVAGSAELMGSDVHLVGEFDAGGSFLIMGSANINVDGLATSTIFTVDNSGIRFEATAEGAVVNEIKGTVTQDLLAVANDAQAAIDYAQAGVNVAKVEVRKLESELATARAKAQREINEIKADIDAAKSVVDSIGASKNYWYKVRKSRYNAWRSAISATKRAPWYHYAYYKGREASKYASYVAAAGTYSSRVVAYNAALATYNGVRDAAGWALDTAGVDANPEVVRISVLLAAADLAVDAAESVLDEVERINSDALQYLNIADSLRVDRITLSGNVANFGNAGVHAKIDCSFAGSNYSLTLQASTDNLVEQLANELAAAIV